MKIAGSVIAPGREPMMCRYPGVELIRALWYCI